MDAKSSETRDLVAAASEGVQIGAAPDWIVPCLYDAVYKEKVWSLAYDATTFRVGRN